MRQQHHPQDIKTYQKGINSDTNNEFLGSSEQGEHVDALNMRSISMDGDNFAKKKIKGESILFPLIDNRCKPVGVITFTKYQCMMSQEINGHIVEIWASNELSEKPMIRIDGVIVAYSQYLPFSLSYPLQYDKNESCVGGEFYVTNNNTPPLVFNVQDLLNNSSSSNCTDKYFSEFQLDAYEIQVSAILYKPAFIKQDPSSSGYDYVVGGTGLNVGSYSYAYRFVDSEGETTEFSPITELIPVVRNASSANGPVYPFSRTFSSEPNTSSPTSYGNHLRIRYQNDNMFSYIELRRDSWYAGDPIGTPPVSQVIASIPVATGMNVINVLDKADALFDGATELDPEEQSSNGANINRAKAIRYFNSRLYLMNVGYESRDIENQVTFVDSSISGRFSTIENLGTAGHKHVYNAAMYKSNMRGEKTGFGVVLFDKSNNPTFALPIPNAVNFDFPNRRDAALTNTLNTSYKGTVRAANTAGVVSQTHEVFDLVNATSKDGQNDTLDADGLMYNYRADSALLPNWWEYTKAQMNPVSQFDTKSKLNKAVNKKVALDSGIGLSPPLWNNYAPDAFGPNYYSQGFAFKGIQSYPSWADGFSVVQTEPAKRVIAQGLGFYTLIPADVTAGSDTQKETNSFWSYFPDLDVLNPEIAEDLINNPSTYSLQLVSPLGYFSEVYNTDKAELDDRRKGADIITYARIIRDYNTLTLSNQINPGLGTSSGISDPSDPGNSFKYVAYGRYTNSLSGGTSPAFPSNGQGNKVFPIVQADDITTNSTRQSYFRIAIDDSATGAIYNQAGMNGAANTTNNANAAGVMEWREPMYVINLIKNVDIPSGVTTEYKYGSNYVKFKSLVLESSGAVNQSAVLVSERWEDCIPQIQGQVNNSYASQKRFVYVQEPTGAVKRWMNYQFETTPNKTAILVGLAAASPAPFVDPVLTGGYPIYGVYGSTESSGDGDNICRVFTLNFNLASGYTAFTVPKSGSKVYVQYDNRFPVRVFGGDTYINESIWAPIDNNYGNDGEPSKVEGGWIYPSNEFKMNAPFPLKSYDFVDNYPIWQNSDPWNYDFGIHFQFCNNSKANAALIRQMIAVWTAETRINLSFAFNVEQPDKAVSDQYYPLINYIPRPYKWNLSDPTDAVQFADDNHLIPDYFDDYGYEWNLWNNGGFRFLMNDLQTNIDYSKSQTNKSFFTKPVVGFEEQLDFCTRIIWSLRRPANAQNAPSIKTFPLANIFDISDDTGEIKFGWSAMSGDKGNNLYAFTDSGVCLLVVDKRVIHEINANELATIGSDVGGILNQLWIDKTIGMHDETWRSWAEYSNALFFTNGISAYTFSDNQLNDIARTGFFELLNRKYNQLIGEGYESRISGGFNVLTKEYIMNVNDQDRLDPQFSTLIYGTQQAALQCQSSYDYDKYLYYKNRLFGMKGSGTYELGVGNEINGDDMPCYLSNVSDAVIIADKEFIRIRVNSNSKPEQIYFYKSYDDYKTDTYDSVVDANAVPLSIKNYFGYECYIPRSIYAPYERNQGRMVIFKIVSSADEDFLVTSTAVQYKALK
jgi:hypothetical protein